MELLFLSLELVSVAVGAGSAFIFDTFFTLSLKDHKIQPHEERMLSRISLFSIISASLGLLVYTFILALQLESGMIGALDIAFAKIFLFAIALLTALTLRKIHLKTLLRYQKTHFHLSLTFGKHDDSIVSTAVFSTLSWIFLITLTALEQYKIAEDISVSIFGVTLAYILIGLVGSRIALYFKNTHLS
ncbi:MAG: hypothetical protein FGM57_01255 [Candidatus Taylorbacteria bacterium]|nr:hypothetical protein [Candidatus Taylorbacteria bacterium]